MSATNLARWIGPRPGGVLAVLLSALAVLGVVSACTSQATPPANQETNFKTVVIPVEGMSCAACVARIKKTLTSIDGVADIEVSLRERRARIRFDPRRLSPDRLVAAINGLGYRAGAPAEAKP